MIRKCVLIMFIMLWTAVPVIAADVEIDDSPGAVGNKGTINAPVTTFSPSASATATGGAGGAGGSATAYGVGPVSGIGNRVLSPSAESTSINTNVNTNTNLNTNTLGQMQGQGQLQGQSQFGYVAPVQEITVNTPRPLPNVPEMSSQINPLIQGGVSHYALLPRLKIKRIAENEVVVKVLKTYNGWLPNRICVEDATEFILLKGEKLLKKRSGYIAPPTKIRFQAYLKNKVKAAGTSGGANAVMSGLNSGSHEYGGGAGAQLLPGYNASWADPTLTIEFYEIE